MNRQDWRATDTSVLCAKHFTPDSYAANVSLLEEFGISTRRKLRPDAVPTLFTHRPVRQAKLRGGFEKRQRKENIDGLLKDASGEHNAPFQHASLEGEKSAACGPTDMCDDSMTSASSVSPALQISQDYKLCQKYLQVALRPTQRHRKVQTATQAVCSSTQTKAFSTAFRDVAVETDMEDLNVSIVWHQR